MYCFVVMDLLIPGRRGAEGAWWKARLRVWWVGRQFLLYTFAMKELKPSGRLKAGSFQTIFQVGLQAPKKMCKCTYESRRNWQSGTIRIPRSIQYPVLPGFWLSEIVFLPQLTGSVFSLHKTHKTDIGSQHRWQSNAISCVLIAWEFQVAPC